MVAGCNHLHFIGNRNSVTGVSCNEWEAKLLGVEGVPRCSGTNPPSLPHISARRTAGTRLRPFQISMERDA
jgi:hypothetical protein